MWSNFSYILVTKKRPLKDSIKIMENIRRHHFFFFSLQIIVSCLFYVWVWLQIISCGWTSCALRRSGQWWWRFSSHLPNCAYLCVVGASASSWSVTVTGCEEDLLWIFGISASPCQLLRNPGFRWYARMHRPPEQGEHLCRQVQSTLAAFETRRNLELLSSDMIQ